MPMTTKDTQKGQTVEVRLLGQKIVLTTQDDPALVKEVVQLASSKLKEAEGRAKTGTAAHQITLLALLDLAEAYVQAKKKAEEHQIQIESKSNELLGLIDAEFK